MNNQVTGRAFIRVSGALIESLPGAKLNLGGVQRNTVKGDNGVHGFSEEPMEAFIECDISHKADTDLQTLKASTDVSVNFETDTGASYVLRNAWLENPLELETASDGGKVSLRFVGLSAEAVT